MDIQTAIIRNFASAMFAADNSGSEAGLREYYDRIVYQCGQSYALYVWQKACDLYDRTKQEEQ